MKILYDHQIFAAQKFGGISRLFFELITNLKQNKTVDVELALKYSTNYYLLHSKLKNQLLPLPKTNRRYKDFYPDLKFKGKGRIFQLINKLTNNVDTEDVNTLFSVDRLNRQDFDVFHPTYYSSYFLQHLKKKPFVLTIYDMIHELYPEYTPLSDPIIYWKKLLVKKANKVIAISENTKKDILKFYDIDENKVMVVPLSSNLNKRPNSNRGRLKLPERYILFVGNRTIYKNFYFFLEAAAKLVQKDKDLKIICAGGGKFNGLEKYFIHVMKLQSNIKYCEASDANLIQLYSHAEAFIYPSIYEGFGIPILEAFEMQCPVVCSNASSFPEVGGDAVEYFDPKDIESMANAISNVIYSKPRKIELIKKGNQRQKLYYPQNIISKTLEVYNSI